MHSFLTCKSLAKRPGPAPRWAVWGGAWGLHCFMAGPMAKFDPPLRAGKAHAQGIAIIQAPIISKLQSLPALWGGWILCWAGGGHCGRAAPPASCPPHTWQLGAGSFTHQTCSKVLDRTLLASRLRCAGIRACACWLGWLAGSPAALMCCPFHTPAACSKPAAGFCFWSTKGSKSDVTGIEVHLSIRVGFSGWGSLQRNPTHICKRPRGALMPCAPCPSHSARPPVLQLVAACCCSHTRCSHRLCTAAEPGKAATCAGHGPRPAGQAGPPAGKATRNPGLPASSPGEQCGG